MSRTVEIVMNTYGLDKALQAYKQNSRKSWAKIFEETAKGLARKLPRVTPPFDVRNTEIEGDADAKKRGMTVLAADISRVFTSSLDKLRENGIKRRPSKEQVAKNSMHATMRSLHSQVRNRRGRVPPRYKAVTLVTKMAMRQYVKRMQRRVGYLGAGWKAAANQTGAKMPTWVRRHSAPSQARVRIEGQQFTAVFANLVKYASQGDLQRRVDFAANRQASDMMKKLVYLTKKRITV